MTRLNGPLLLIAMWLTAAAGLTNAGCGAAPIEEEASDAGLEGEVFKASGCEGRCSSKCPCEVGEGDCDRNADCKGNLVCPPDRKGKEVCERPGGGGSCDGRCSPSCPCEEGEGDCDRNADCKGSLVCPPNQPGTEFCEQPSRGSCEGGCSPSCPCDEGEGDCDRDADCAGNLVCPPNQPGTEFCEKPRSSGGDDDDNDDDDDNGGGSAGDSNLQIRLGGQWRGVCCNGGELEVSNRSCKWREGSRRLTTKDVRTGRDTKLDCPENKQRPADCSCTSSGEAMHGIKADGNVQVRNSLRKAQGAPIYPNSGHEMCIDQVNGELQSRRSSSSCPNWRLVNFY